MKRRATQSENANESGRTAKRVLTDEHVKKYFRDDLFDEETLAASKRAYRQSKPYKYGVINDLIEPTLLQNVRAEIEANLSFTPKETDIYRIHQSGDLANLDGLDDDSLRLLPSLVTLRDSLYSSQFREYLAEVTGSGPLSGRKTDMAVNIYTPGCHLLCHDDVIGSRRVSYILYLTDPDKPWRKAWGGALRLYPTHECQTQDGDKVRVPDPYFTVTIPPAFSQLSFFAVQPGESYHDVEEVYARREDDGDEDDGGRIRMAISGWYHIPQEGEDGYEAGAEQAQAQRSSLAQLQGKSGQFDEPQPQWIDPVAPAQDIASMQEEQEGDSDLNESDLNFLLKFMNPRYLTPDVVGEVGEAFQSDSSVRLGLFLSDKFSASLRKQVTEFEQPGPAMQDAQQAWSVASPPYKQRYLFRQPEGAQGAVSPDDNPLLSLYCTLFPSISFHKWLSLVSGLTLSQCNVMARRFRRGRDYTLATAYTEDSPQVEVCLGITPTKGWASEDADDEAEAGASDSANGTKSNGTKVNGHNKTKSATRPPEEEGGVGGYEVYMAGDDEDEEHELAHDNGKAKSSSHTGAGERRGKNADPAVYQAQNGDDDDGVLFSMEAAWNMMTIVLRDSGVLKFVKYVSQSAPGDRWDVVGEWRVEDYSDDEEEDEEEGEVEAGEGEDGEDEDLEEGEDD